MLKNPGLNPDQVIKSRKAHGINSLVREQSGNFRILLREIVSEPMFILLSVASIIYFVLGENTEGIMLVTAIILVASISVFQNIRSKSAIKALEQISNAKAKVYRSGVLKEILFTEVVVGDHILIEEGDAIPADAIISESYDFSVNESLLTGEAFSVAKSEGDIFSGTIVVSGSAVAIVSNVGKDTAIGKIGFSMEQIKPGKTSLQSQIATFVRSMAIFGAIAFVFVWVVNFINTGEVLESLLRGLTLAMSALPEEIPVAFSTFMALGAWRLLQKNILTKQPQTVESLGAASAICLDKTGTITENKMVVQDLFSYDDLKTTQVSLCQDPSCRQVLHDAMVASEISPFDPMEKAIHEAYKLNNERSAPIEPKMIHEYPLEGSPPMMTHVQEIAGEIHIASKGSWEKIVQVCALPEKEIRIVEKEANRLAETGMRVLGTAHAQVDHNSKFPENQEAFPWKFSGLIALSDPPKRNIKEVFSKFYRAGVTIKMITGDHPQTAMAIARQSGIKKTATYVTGPQIMDMNEDELRQKIEETDVFARMNPAAKLRVIATLKSMGEVVAMTGDGVNDGPALKAADIGIAMGKRGTTLARAAAKMILVDDNLEGMVEAIAAGRKIYLNLKKAFRYIISIHIPIIMVVTLPLLLNWKYPNIFTPVHVIFLELIMGPTCSIIYENEPAEPGLMENNPRKVGESLFSLSELSLSIIQGLMIGLGVLLIYQYSIASDLDVTMTRTLSFTTLIFSNVLLTLVNRSFTKSIFKVLLYKNNLVPIIIGITLTLWWISVNFSAAQSLFGFNHLESHQIIKCALVAAGSVLWIEIVKLFNHGIVQSKSIGSAH